MHQAREYLGREPMHNRFRNSRCDENFRRDAERDRRSTIDSCSVVRAFARSHLALTVSVLIWNRTAWLRRLDDLHTLED